LALKLCQDCVELLPIHHRAKTFVSRAIAEEKKTEKKAACRQNSLSKMKLRDRDRDRERDRHEEQAESFVISRHSLDLLRSKHCSSGPAQTLLSRATRTGPLNIAVFDPSFRGIRHKFPERNMTKLKAVDQKVSGRCWLMAGLNLLRHKSVKEGKINAEHVNKLDDFELSGNYLMFFDKWEKCMYFLDQIRKTRHEEIGSQNVQYLLMNPISDGGQFSMFVDLIEKYGIVPADIMPDSYHAGRTRELNEILALVLRSTVPEVRNASEQDFSALRKLTLERTFKVLIDTLGCPPESFELSPGLGSMSPLQFYRSLEPSNLTDYISLVHVPEAERPMNTVFEVEGLGSVVGGRPVRYLNVPLDVMYKATVASADLGLRVWLGCDVNKHRHEKDGLLDPEVFDWHLLLGYDPNLPRSEKLLYRQGAVTHAMAIVDYDEDGSLLIENSWGTAHKNGYLHMTRSWFDQHVYQVEVPPQVLPAKYRKLWQSQRAQLLPRWDPLGVLLGKCCENENENH
jgi:bleomycin hydrolase